MILFLPPKMYAHSNDLFFLVELPKFSNVILRKSPKDSE